MYIASSVIGEDPFAHDAGSLIYCKCRMFIWSWITVKFNYSIFVITSSPAQNWGYFQVCYIFLDNIYTIPSSYTLSYYSALSISRDHFFLYKSRKTSNSMPEVLPSNLLCWVQYRVLLHRDISRVYSIRQSRKFSYMNLDLNIQIFTSSDYTSSWHTIILLKLVYKSRAADGISDRWWQCSILKAFHSFTFV